MPSFIHNLTLMAVRNGLVPNPMKSAYETQTVFRTKPAPWLVKKHNIQHTTFDSQCVYTYGQPKNTQPILYFGHGGAFVTGMFESYYMALGRLHQALGMPIIVPDYPMPVETDALGMRQWILSHFHKVLQDFPDSPIVIAGDSAGANLVLALAQALTEPERARVHAVFALYGWFNLERRQNDYPNNREEVLLSPDLIPKTARRFAGDLALTDSSISPIFGDLSDLPNLHIVSADKDMLYQDSVDLERKAKAARLSVQHTIHYGYGHDFWLFPTPDGNKAVKALAADMNLAVRK